MMNIYTVRDNLLNTVRGKEEMLAEYIKEEITAQGPDLVMTRAMIKFLEVNLDELYAILTDVQVCCKQATEDSWRMYPDRMGQ